MFVMFLKTKMQSVFKFSLFLILLVMINQSQAAIRPSFFLEDSSWRATDIVLASEGGIIDGNFVVIEAWKGTLAPGDSLSIPELAKFSEENIQTVDSRLITSDDKNQMVMSGQRMILFLMKASLLQRTDVQWLPANIFNDMNVSVVWIEQDKTYAFTQLINPGPSILMQQRSLEKDMKKEVHAIKQIQKSLSEIAIEPNIAERVKKVSPYSHSDVSYARDEAFRILGECKTEAVPTLRAMLDDEANADFYSKIVDSLFTAGGKELGPEFSKLVEKEINFWKERAPSLKIGWWNNSESNDRRMLRNRYGKILHILYSLKGMRYEGSREPVAAFRDFWRSLPQLEDKSGISQMSKACDDVLKALDAKD